MTTMQARPVPAGEVDAMFQQLNNWGRWGADDQRGALNLISAAKLKQAASLVREGVSVSCSLPLNTTGGADNTSPVVHLMVAAGDIEGAGASFDYFAIAPHGIAHTHLDALCHVFYRGQMYNGFPASRVTSRGALANSIESGIDGIVSRGVLLDIPRLLGKQWLEPGETIYVEDLEAAEKAQRLEVQEGDILLVRTGRHLRKASTGEIETREGMAGLHMSCMPWLRERGVALLGCDGVSDVRPSGLPAGPASLLPVHILTIAAMGIHLLDNAQLDDLAGVCSRYERWEFQLTLAPLRLLRGTASPVNPIAVF